MTASDTRYKESGTNQPNMDIKTDKVFESSNKKGDELILKYIGTDYSYKHTIVWKNAIGFLILHLFALWGVILMFTGGVTFKTILWSKLLIIILICVLKSELSNIFYCVLFSNICGVCSHRRCNYWGS